MKSSVLYKSTDWPMNLILYCQNSPCAAPIINLPPDFEGTLEYVLHALETTVPRDVLMLRMRFQEKKTLQEIADTNSVSPERVRQVIQHTCRLIRNPKRWRLLQFGLEGIQKQCYQSGYESGYESGYRKGVDDYINGTGAFAPDKTPEGSGCVISRKLDDLGLSVRSCNCLYRAGKLDAFAVLDMTWNELIRIRGVGVKCADEIVEKLKSLGYDTTKLEGGQCE